MMLRHFQLGKATMASSVTPSFAASARRLANQGRRKRADRGDLENLSSFEGKSFLSLLQLRLLNADYHRLSKKLGGRK